MTTMRLVSIGAIIALVLGYMYYLTTPGEWEADETVPSVSLPIPSDEWHEFTPGSNRFVAQFPTEPKLIKRNLNGEADSATHQYEEYYAEDPQGSIFRVSLVTYPDAKILKSPSQRLTAVMEQMMRSDPTNVLRDIRKALFQGHEALDFSIQGQKVRSIYKAIISGNTTYLLAYAAQRSNYDEDEFKFFVSQFHLLNSEN